MSVHNVAHTECRGMMRSAGLIGVATLCSRVLGFFRDMVIARMFGVYVYAQAFVVAFRIPNLFRDIVGEGAVNSSFVPVFSQYRLKHNREEFWELANAALNILLVVLCVIVILGMTFSPYIIKAFAPGFSADPEKFRVTVALNRMVFPYLLLISLSAYTMAILNSLKHFAVPAFAPCLLNISIIVFSVIFGESLSGMAAGILVGGMLQLGIQLPVLYSRGFRLNGFMRRFSHPGAREMFRLLVPRMFGTCVYQLSNFVDSIFGSLAFIVGDGGVAILYFAYRLVQFPVGIFGNAVSQAALPLMSAQAAEGGRTEDLKKTLSLGLRHVFFFMFPASALLMSLSRPIIRGVFQGGRFDAYASAATSDALLFYSIGLFAYAGSKLLNSCFFALKDTRTPVKVSAVALGMSIALNSLLMFPLKIKGLALASSLSGIISFFMLLRLLNRRTGGIGLKNIAFSSIRILAASILCGLSCFLLSLKFPCGEGAGLLVRVLWLFVYFSAGSAVYLSVCLVFKCEEVKEIWGWLKKPSRV